MSFNLGSRESNHDIEVLDQEKSANPGLRRDLLPYSKKSIET